MRFTHATAIAAYILSSSELVAAAPPIVKDVYHTAADVSKLGDLTFKVQQKANPHFRTFGGRGAMAKARALRKYGVPIPNDLREVVDRIVQRHGGPIRSDQQEGATAESDLGDDKGETSALPELFDLEYLSPVQIGTPAQTLMLDLDTGSSDLWVFSSLTSKTSVKGQTIYDINASSTASKVDHASWSIHYGDGSGSSGIVYTDTVSVGAVTVDHQAVEVAVYVSASFTMDPHSDGILGLGFSKINQVHPVQQKTFFDNAMPGLAEPLFSANLLPGEAGNYNFGFIDSTEYTGDIVYVPIDASGGFWEFSASAISVNGGTSNPLVHNAIMDTGTTLLLVPSNVSNLYYSQVPGAVNDPNQGGWVFDCNTKLPEIAIDIGGYTAVIPGELIRYAPTDTDEFSTASSCYGGIQSSAGIPFAIYGDVFLKSQFVVFHGANEELGFAAKARSYELDHY